ncbi:hypothetical protein K3495_g15437 [Podosphaera aphanis]|nr:hypothetical protein K3495_g15437 [Podosphaera aphanis]
MSSHTAILKSDVPQRRNNIGIQPSDRFSIAQVNIPFTCAQASEVLPTSNWDWSTPEFPNYRNYRTSGVLSSPGNILVDHQHFSSGDMPSILHSNATSLEAVEQMIAPEHPGWMNPYPEIYQSGCLPMMDGSLPSHQVSQPVAWYPHYDVNPQDHCNMGFQRSWFAS